MPKEDPQTEKSVKNGNPLRPKRPASIQREDATSGRAKFTENGAQNQRGTIVGIKKKK